MCRPPRIPANAYERTARRSVPTTVVGCVRRALETRSADGNRLAAVFWFDTEA